MTGPRRARTALSEVTAALCTGAVVFGAVPIALVVIARVPVPRRLDWPAVVSAHGLFDLLAVLAWIAWVGAAWTMLRSVAERVRRGDPASGRGGWLVDALASRIAAGLLVALPFTLSVATATAGAAAARPVVASAPAGGTPSAPPAPTAASALQQATYVVAPGDSLWSIAEELYGDGSAWDLLAGANLGTVMDDGTTFVDPSMIQPGWRLRVPEADAPAPETDPAPVTPVDAPGREHTTSTTVARVKAPTRSAELPELAALGVGVLGAAGLARHRRVRRRQRALHRPEGLLPRRPGDLEADTDVLLQPFAQMPVLEWVELANRSIGTALRGASPAADVPLVRAVSVGPDALTAHLEHAVGWAPPGWTGAASRRWRLPFGADRAVVEEGLDDGPPWCRALVPIGESEDATWLIPLAAGTVLSILGAGAQGLAETLRCELASSTDADEPCVTDDARLVELEHGVSGADGAPDTVFFGDPEVLGTDAGRRVAVVTLSDGPADVTVVVDGRGATIHPIGIVVEPHVLAPAHREVLLGSGTTAAPERDDGAGASEAVVRSELDGLGGAVAVRLLTPVPRIDGLRAPLPPKRARRSVELVAYLALHRPDPVTSDRLRTRVLGSADADAAAKTLFNTASAARRALGTDGTGDPLLPVATPGGHYRLSPAVGVDVVRLEELVRLAGAQDDPVTALAMLRGALELIEGEPLATALSGYSWWHAEGHAARLCAVAADATCEAVRLALEQGHVELAQWAVRKGRLVDADSELLSRAAMRAAAACGDADSLRREWLDCQRRVDDIDPGALPSEETEHLYHELTRRLPEPAHTGAPA
jgi:DNA-binding SARP family transcriptional activator